MEPDRHHTTLHGAPATIPERSVAAAPATSQTVSKAPATRGHTPTDRSGRRDFVFAPNASSRSESAARVAVAPLADSRPVEVDIFLTVQDIASRYGIGRTRAYQLVKEQWFPKPVVDGPYRWSLASVRAAEAKRASGENVSPPVERPMPKRRRGAA